MVRLGIFGGSFNPIHLGHIAVAQNILKSGLIDELWLLVSPQNPLKSHDNLLPEDLRLELARTAVVNHPNLHVSDFEFQLPRPSYMYRTLTALNKACPQYELSLVVGADSWLTFNHWYHNEDILKHYSLIVYPRQGYSVDVHTLPPNVFFIHQEIFPISSTEIRQKLLHHEDVSKWLDPAVEKRLDEYFQIKQY
jgi:nicotinate-nucleotide adenylyltransferase